MILDDETETQTLDPQAAAEHAFAEAAAGFTLFNEPLAPYARMRKVAAQSMGMLYPYVGEAGAEQMAKTGMYPGALKDIIILLWLCTLKDASDLTKEDIRSGAWSPARACNKPADALETAMQWADAAGILDVQGAKFEEAQQVFMAIVSGVAASEFVLKLSTREPEGDSPNG